jgi:DNA-binding GntR family transcriptional regulator
MLKEVIRSQPLHEQVIGHVREMILEAVLKPGERISEKQLCEQLGISRTPLREALKVLASEGLVNLLARRGAEVTEVTTEKLEEKFAVIRMVESFAFEHMDSNCTPELIDELEVIQAQMTAAYAKSNLRKYFTFNEKFHKAIVSSTNNQTMIELHASLTDHLRRARIFGLRSHPIGKEFINAHARIIKALRKNDFARAKTEISEHLERVKGEVLNSIRNR